MNMALAGNDVDNILQRIYDIIYDETKDYFEELTIENIRGTIWSIYDSIVDAIRYDVGTYVDDLAARILEECKEE